MHLCNEDSLESRGGYSSDLDFYASDVEVERPNHSATSALPLELSYWMSKLPTLPTPSISDNSLQSPIGNRTPGTASEPRIKRGKTKSPQSAIRRLDMSLYMPLGSFTYVPVPGVKVSRKWKESVKPPDCLPDNHPMVLPLGQLLGTACIRLFTGKNQTTETLATTRVYVLPDDVGLAKLPRSQRKHRTALRTVINSLNTTKEGWLRCTGLSSAGIVSGSESEEEEDSLFYIFNTLKSPQPNVSKIEDSYARNAVDGLIRGQPVIYGLKTELYPYQCRSAAKMIQREVNPARMLDPRLETLIGPTGRTFYFDGEACMLYSQGSEYDEARGGILAETMGYGKTLICLATILQTKGHWPRIPPRFSENLHPVRPQVGSLVEVAAAAANRAQIPWKSYFEQLSRDGDDFGNCVRALEANPVAYRIPGESKKSARAGGTGAQPDIIRLCSATVIIVPSNLVSQWRNQIKLHLEEDCLSVLVMEDLHERMPAASKLLSYDIILISKPRFEREYALEGVLMQDGMRRDNCCCGSTLCRCPYRSPLRAMHFLRLVVDEGHSFVSSGALTNAANLLSQLHVERKWIVSGTPSSGLIGVELDIAALETVGMAFKSDGSVNQEILATRRKEVSLAQERKDIEKIGRIVVDFLRLRPWATVKGDADAVSWRKYVMPSATGIRKVASLKSTLEGLVVRHRIEDIEADLKLPPLSNRVVHIEPAYFDKLSINLFISALTANAITSERTDQDYMFHARNRKQLDQLVRNLRQSGFYWTGFEPHEVAETIRISSEYATNPENVIPLDDLRSLEEAIRIGQICLNSAAWTAMCQFSEMGLFVDGFPEEASHGWALDSQVGRKPLLIGTTPLQLAQKHVQKNLYASNPAAGLFVAGVAAMDKVRNKGHESKPSPSKDPSLARYKARSKVKRVIPDSTIVAVSALANRNITARAPGFTVTTEISPLKTLPQQQSGLRSAMKSGSKSNALGTPKLPPDSPLTKTRLVGTASAKLSYLLDQVSLLHQSEKILIFYEGDHIAWYIAQCLELINVQHLIYAKGTSLALRNAYMETFNATETFRVLLMDLRQAAHGLHVASASRVFFVNPVWQPNVEAQAIKRAHRIGQSRPVYVETLVLKDTVEEQLLQRRQSMTIQEHLKAAKSPLDDSAMNEMIRNATFVRIHDWEMEDARKQMAPLSYPQYVFQSGQAGGVADITKARIGQLISPATIPQAESLKRKTAFHPDRNDSSGNSEAVLKPKKMVKITFRTS